ncbi:13376_t:CDS:1 [Racocetra fulgida]|uniref:13376_t:CDS:1 n=1 Tax=Racocetra fulgida TaxID=60492 RepID=A0A9N9GIH6_9GLOM|nr:13376_t:CDS:1 [Racocetra fulgida]
MAKSLRSKIKRRFRSIKRKTVFAPVEDARTFRLASKLSQDASVTIRPNQQHNGIISDTSLTVETTQQDPQLQLTSDIISSECTDHKTIPTNMLETQDVSGSLCYEILGLLNPDFVDVTNLAGLAHIFSDILKESF